MPFIDQKELLQRTHGGIDIILSYYPQAEPCVQDERRAFKVREEKTPSAKLKYKAEDGVWLVTDFGGDQVSRNGIQICMFEEGIDFKEALDLLAGKFMPDVNTGLKTGAIDVPKPGFEKREAKPDEKEGEYYFELHEEIPESFLRELGPYVTDQDCQYLHFFAVKSFTYIKDRKALITSSTDEYPIFIIQEETFKKIYQPRNPEKQYRFRYVGEKPKDFIHGLEQCIKKHAQMVADQDASDMSSQENGEKESGRKDPKLPEIILCSGDRDASNIHSLGYNVIWLNSESAKIISEVYKKIMQLTDDFYNVPDIDSTGIKQGTSLALKYIDLKTIYLPRELRQKRDFRGNPCKDVTDLLKVYKRGEFKKLKEVALPARFWDQVSKFTKQGEWVGFDFVFNNAQAYHFLHLNGFYRFENRNEKSGFVFVHVDGNIVEETDPVRVKTFVNDFLKHRKLEVKLRNMIYKTTQLAEISLSNLDILKIDFTDFDRESQFLFFENKTWRITKEEIREYRPGEVDKVAWRDEVIPHHVRYLPGTKNRDKKEHPEFFKIKCTEMEDGEREYDIDILDSSPVFMKFLIQTSRIFWRKEYEEIAKTMDGDEKEKYLQEIAFRIDNPQLTAEEIHEQKLHLINKIYSLGYLLHRYKEPSRPWCVFAMDNKITDEAESHGGSGKSLVYNCLRYFMKSVTLNGRNPKLTDNPHIYENVTEHTDYVFIDDADRYLKFQFFFKSLTGDLDVNPKNNRQYSIPFHQAPKFCITSNYTLRNIDPSTERRLLYTVFSDYYHYNSNSEYNEHRDPKNDFGMNLFDDFTEEEWNYFFNFMAQCLKAYLNFPKIDPPMDNVTKRNLQTEMTDSFKKWADVYFSPENNKLDRLLPRKDAFENFKEETKMTKWTINRFTRAMKAWCRYYEYDIDPSQLHNSQGRIIRKIEGMATEMLYIQTKNEINTSDYDENQVRMDFKSGDGDKAPF